MKLSEIKNILKRTYVDQKGMGGTHTKGLNLLFLNQFGSRLKT